MRHRSILAVLTLAALLAAGCGAKSTSSSVGGTAAGGASGASNAVLRIPYLADMSVPDPDVFYDIEGNSVILNSYDGLLKYAPGSSRIVGSLAASWTVSPDRLTYTFHLRPGVRFHDGSKLTSTAVKASFERRLAVAQAPSYMLEPVKSMLTPKPLELVIKLKHPVNPFLAYMASSWGPKIIGPGAITQHAGSDHAQTWLRTHEDGTGPYEITAFDRGRQYVLTRAPGYWGTAPYFQKIIFKITPDIGTQRLELQNGDLDAILHSFPASELSSLPSNLTVKRESSYLRLLLYVNTNRAPFSDPAIRAGLRSTFDVGQLVSQAYAGTATASTGAYPPGLLPSQPGLPYKPNTAAAKAISAKAKTRSITLAYTADESGVQRRASELLQAQLSAAGYDVTLKEVQLPQVYGYVKDLAHAPDLLLVTNTPDAADPDTWARILFYSSGGLDFLGFKDPTIDKLLDQAVSAPKAKADALYSQVGQRVLDSNEMFFLGDVKNVFVLSNKLTNVQAVPAYPWTVDLAALRGTG
ncbi:MAG: peptide/nickel transport system substrate-binding protein [Solirubrobacteraceae bacterium]|jgi:peptide/nickel transport system substrate-binding protein|nr:peptide/nickel transport system substrate-binding protein [Solirubrobacteraceae bacterium]